jgi:hypothetical protein
LIYPRVRIYFEILFIYWEGKDILTFFFIMIYGRWVGHGYLLLYIHGWDKKTGMHLLI